MQAVQVAGGQGRRRRGPRRRPRAPVHHGAKPPLAGYHVLVRSRHQAHVHVRRVWLALLHEDMFDTNLEAVLPHYRFYYECLMKPNARSVLTALRKCASDGADPLDNDFAGICNGHGPLLKFNVEELVGGYKKWSEDALEKAKAATTVFYTSDYGFSDRLSQSIARGLTKADVEVTMMDMNTEDTQELIEAVSKAAGIVLVVPPATGPAHDNLAAIIGNIKSKQKILIAESYGGNDEPVGPLASQFAGMGVEEVVPALKVKENPTEATYQLFEESGTDLGQVLTKKETLKAMKNAMSSTSPALGRSRRAVRRHGGEGTAKSAMIASWIAQASFEPLGSPSPSSGPRDRIVDAGGDKFVLNCSPSRASSR